MYTIYIYIYIRNDVYQSCVKIQDNYDSRLSSTCIYYCVDCIRMSGLRLKMKMHMLQNLSSHLYIC